MNRLKIFRRKYAILIFTAIIVPVFLSCNFSKKTDIQLVIPDIQSEDRDIATFLVSATEINSGIIELNTLSQVNSKSIDVKDLFSEQLQLTAEIQTKIKQIAQERFVTIPLPYKNNKVKYTNDVALLDLLLNKLIVQMNLFESIKNKTDDLKILNLKDEYLPKLNVQSQKASSLKVKKIVTN